MAVLEGGKRVLTGLFTRSVCYRAVVSRTLTNTRNTARGIRYTSKSRALSRALFTINNGSDAELTAHHSYKQQHDGAVFNLDVLVCLLREENAQDVCVIRVPDELKYTEYFIIATAISPQHLRAMTLYTNKLYKFLRRDGDPHTHIEGRDSDDWMCIDFGSMVVHFMLPETRERYQLETLWTMRSYEQLIGNTQTHILPPDFILSQTHTHTQSDMNCL